MSRRRLGLAALVIVAACSSAAPPDAVSGIVVEVMGDLEDVTSFTVLVEGERIVFTPSPDGDFAFPLSHLQDHLRSGEPVVVGWELVDDAYVANFIDDA